MSNEVENQSKSSEECVFSGFYTLEGVEYALYTPSDYSNDSSWKYYNEDVPEGLTDNDGLANTEFLLGSIEAYKFMLSDEKPFAAAFDCKNLTYAGKNDWYLPSYEEVLAIRSYRKLSRLPVWTSSSNKSHCKIDAPVAHHKFILVPHYHGLPIMPVRRVKVT